MEERSRLWKVKSKSWEEVQKGKGIEDTQSSNAVLGIRRVGERKGRGERAKKAKCELRWAGGQSRVGVQYAVALVLVLPVSIHCVRWKEVPEVGNRRSYR
jgi:hypothetical protein